MFPKLSIFFPSSLLLFQSITLLRPLIPYFVIPSLKTLWPLKFPKLSISFHFSLPFVRCIIPTINHILTILNFQPIKHLQLLAAHRAALQIEDILKNVRSLKFPRLCILFLSSLSFSSTDSSTLNLHLRWTILGPLNPAVNSVGPRSSELIFPRIFFVEEISSSNFHPPNTSFHRFLHLRFAMHDTSFPSSTSTSL